MDGDYISRHEHEEFRRSMEAENQRLEDENKIGRASCRERVCLYV